MFIWGNMVQFFGGKDVKLIFNYFEKDSEKYRSALLSAVTGYYPFDYAESGIFALQYINNCPVSVVANGESYSLLFATSKTDFDELKFTLREEIHSPNFLPLPCLDKYYLFEKDVSLIFLEKTSPKAFLEDFNTILKLNGVPDNTGLEYHLKKGDLVPVTFDCNGEKLGGGFITNSKDYAVISHLFVKEEYRKQGYGGRIVKNLLQVSASETVYLTSGKENIEFYKNLGFTPVLTVYKYRNI